MIIFYKQNSQQMKFLNSRGKNYQKMKCLGHFCVSNQGDLHIYISNPEVLLVKGLKGWSLTQNNERIFQAMNRNRQHIIEDAPY